MAAFDTSARRVRASGSTSAPLQGGVRRELRRLEREHAVERLAHHVVQLRPGNRLLARRGDPAFTDAGSGGRAGRGRRRRCPCRHPAGAQRGADPRRLTAGPHRGLPLRNRHQHLPVLWVVATAAASAASWLDRVAICSPSCAWRTPDSRRPPSKTSCSAVIAVRKLLIGSGWLRASMAKFSGPNWRWASSEPEHEDRLVAALPALGDVQARETSRPAPGRRERPLPARRRGCANGRVLPHRAGQSRRPGTAAPGLAPRSGRWRRGGQRRTGDDDGSKGICIRVSRDAGNRQSVHPLRRARLRLPSSA